MSVERRNIRWALRPGAIILEREQYLAENAQDPEVRRQAKARIMYTQVLETYHHKNLPDIFKGYKTRDLLMTWAEIRCPEGTRAPREQILTMQALLREYKLGIHGMKTTLDKPNE